MLDPTKRFSGRVENYARYRPGYPGEIIGFLSGRCGLAKQSIIADIGSGTGKLSELFLKNGNPLFGVEPNREMREAGERLLGHYPHFTSITGTAEATTLAAGAVDFIVAGQAFHWFNHERCRAEFLRVLKPGGWVVIVANRRRKDARPFAAAYEKLTDEFSTDGEQAPRRRIERVAIEQFFPVPAGFEIFYHAQEFDFEGLKGRLLSSSYAPDAGQPGHEEMLAALRRIFEACQENGRVIFEYETQVYYGRLI
ncbi:MAG TPA: class I SAM-dependent methyltransferase [Verrucomicrobiae bacterium]|jgi:SAM-dependent methyltransferase